MKGALPMTNKYDEQPNKENEFDEEYAAEISPTRMHFDKRYDDRKEVTAKAAGSTGGFIALTLAGLSIFAFPTVFGLVALLLGIYAYNRGATTTGSIAAIIGGVTALFALLFRMSIIAAFFSLFLKVRPQSVK
ncbi:imidazole glycerol phosphate synthase [Bacillus manliponensis]|uniref:imidazole glycerol phosphate synthase n=1 Tax=Bacillus manliponensis TaxID=574376 RepID=UPI003518A17A